VTALTKERSRSQEAWKYIQFTLASGNKAYKGGLAAIDQSTGKCEPGHNESDLFPVGVFAETVDATSAEKLVNVDLQEEIWVEWWKNDTGTAVTAAMVTGLCYILDDQTVTADATGASIAGRVWKVDSVKGVAVQKLSGGSGSPASTLGGLEMVETTLAAFSSNNINVPSDPASGAVYEIPATAAASTVTLPATAAEGTELTFLADGTLNGHTVQYRDATGPVNVTTALTASKRHMVKAVFLNSVWRAIAYVSP
jgi:hypothetical protein